MTAVATPTDDVAAAIDALLSSEADYYLRGDELPAEGRRRIRALIRRQAEENAVAAWARQPRRRP